MNNWVVLRCSKIYEVGALVLLAWSNAIWSTPSKLMINLDFFKIHGFQMDLLVVWLGGDIYCNFDDYILKSEMLS